MKTLEFKELNLCELEEVNGGWGRLVFALGFQIAMEIMDGTFFDDVKKGFNEVMDN